MYNFTLASISSMVLIEMMLRLTYRAVPLGLIPHEGMDGFPARDDLIDAYQFLVKATVEVAQTFIVSVLDVV